MGFYSQNAVDLLKELRIELHVVLREHGLLNSTIELPMKVKRLSDIQSYSVVERDRSDQLGETIDYYQKIGKSTVYRSKFCQELYFYILERTDMWELFQQTGFLLQSYGV